MRPQHPGTEVIDTCACLKVRRASRAVAHVWDAALTPGEVTNGQLALLAQIKLRGRVSISTLAYGLRLDRTSLTRNLARLKEREAVVVEASAGDGRKRLVMLTPIGERLLAYAFPHWEEAQRRLMTSVGKEAWGKALHVTGQLVAAASTKRRGPRPKYSSDDKQAASYAAPGQLTQKQLEILQREMCMCTTLRRCARATSKPYDKGLSPLKIKISQFHLLAAVDAFPGTRLSGFVDILTLDQTSLSRLLQHLTSVGLLCRNDKDPERRDFTLTKAGRALLEKGLVEWRRAQSAFGGILKSENGIQAKGATSLISSNASELVGKIADSIGLAGNDAPGAI